MALHLRALACRILLRVLLCDDDDGPVFSWDVLEAAPALIEIVMLYVLILMSSHCLAEQPCNLSLRLYVIAHWGNFRS